MRIIKKKILFTSISSSRIISKRRIILATLFLSLLFTGYHLVFAQEKKPSYGTGIMLFLSASDEVIIVSPTMDEKKIEEGRLSCERKKAYLERNFGIKVKIMADTDLTDNDKKGNLIIVGKSNRLLQEIWQKMPIRVTPDNFYFLGVEYSNPRDYAIFLQFNPFNASSVFLVCTTIDPDIDKIRPFPSIGSDWVIMRDFSIIRQGRFHSGVTFPPQADPLAEFYNGDTIDKFYSGLSKHISQFYEVYYSPSSLNKEKIPEGVRKREAALLAILKKTGAKPPDRKFKIFCYKDKNEKNDISGLPNPIHFLDRKKEVHMIENILFADSTHEDAHIVAGFILSDSASVHLTEGLAVYLDSVWKGKSLSYWSGFFLRLGTLPSVARLLDEREFVRFASDFSFPLIGSLTETIIEKYGMEKFKILLGKDKISDSILRSVIGQDLTQLESTWLSDIKTKSAAHSRNIEFDLHNNAARESLEKKDYSSAAIELLKALEIIPDDPQVLFNLASAYIRIPDLQQSEKYFMKLVSLDLPESERRFITFGHYQLGRVYDLMGKREKAVEEYNKVLALPDMHNSHRLARERLDRPATDYDFE
ncbi:MAG: hypothetical protein AB1756_03460 [Acidobacteriota bacterium]